MAAWRAGHPVDRDGPTSPGLDGCRRPLRRLAVLAPGLATAAAGRPRRHARRRCSRRTPGREPAPAGGARAAGTRPRGPHGRDRRGAHAPPRPRTGGAARALRGPARTGPRLDDPRRLPRRAGRARRGHPPGAAARPDVSAVAPRRPGDADVTRLTTCADEGSVARRAADHIERALARASEQRGVAHLALSGGTTPGSTYKLLAGEAAALGEVQLWFADERCVPPEDEQSNYLLADRTLIAPAGLPPERVPRMAGELGPERGAAAYAEELTARLGGEGAPPGPDLIVLGIGPDGHVASLFPGAPTLDAGGEAIALGVSDSPKPPPERITLSLAVLRAGRGCLLLATGTRRPTRSTRCSASRRAMSPRVSWPARA